MVRLARRPGEQSDAVAKNGGLFCKGRRSTRSGGLNQGARPTNAIAAASCLTAELAAPDCCTAQLYQNSIGLDISRGACSRTGAGYSSPRQNKPSGATMTAYQLNSGNVVQDTIDGEALAIRSDTGTYYSMSGPGATCWVALLSGAALDRAAAAVAAHHGAPLEAVEGDLSRFADSLVEEHLLLTASTPARSVGELPAELKNTAWNTPQFDKYTDMQDLLLFDPIHEVQPSGWPARADPAP